MTNENTEALSRLRQAFDVTQTEFAQWMGVPLRTFQDLETGKSPIRPIHIRAAQMAALLLAREQGAPERLDDDLKRLVASLVI